MSLIAPQDLLNYTDAIAAIWDLCQLTLGSKSQPFNLGGTVNAPSVRNQMNILLTHVGALDDPEQEMDLEPEVYTDFNNRVHTEAFFASFPNLLNQLSGHCSTRGKQVNATIVDLPSYLSYYSGGTGGAKFTNMLAPSLQAVFQQLNNNNKLPYPVVMNAEVSPITNATAYPNGFGLRAVAGSFVPGFTIDNTTFAELQPVVVVTVNFAGGAAPPTITIAGVDDQGNTTTTWTAQNVIGNNPTSALATQTISSGSIAGQTRQTVTVGSTTGMVPGSCLTINKGLPDQEVVIVEAVPSGTTFTAAFKVSHAANATVDGSTTYATLASSSGRRCRQVTGITIGISGHSAGTVRVDGAQDRVGIAVARA